MVGCVRGHAAGHVIEDLEESERRLPDRDTRITGSLLHTQAAIDWLSASPGRRVPQCAVLLVIKALNVAIKPARDNSR